MKRENVSGGGAAEGDSVRVGVVGGGGFLMEKTNW